jgi:hypothetical protein
MVDERGGNHHELEKQADSRDTDGSSHVLAYVPASQGRRIARLSLGAVPVNRRSVGNLRFAFREVKVATPGGSAPPLRDCLALQPCFSLP